MLEKFRNTKFYKSLNNTYIKVSKALSFIPEWFSARISHKSRKIIWGVVFVLPLMIGFVYFFLIPFLSSIIYSLSHVEIENGLQTTFIGLDNYRYVFTEAGTTDGSFVELLVQAVLAIVTDIPVILIFSLIIAVVLNSKFKGRAVARAIFFMPVIFNSQAIDMAMSSIGTSVLDQTMEGATLDLFAHMFNFEDFLLNANLPNWLISFLVLASARIYDIVRFSGVQILIFLAAIQSVPRHLYEAAKMEGATQYEMFWKITFPMVSPMMLTAAVYTVVDSFLRSPIIGIINDYRVPGFIDTAELGPLTQYGINAAMSWTFAIICVVIVALVLLILSKAVFYYDE